MSTRASEPIAMGVRLRLVRILARPIFRRATREALQGRPLKPGTGACGRWLRADVKAFREATWRRVEALSASSLPARLLTRSRRRRLERTLRLLMRFPFSAPGKPGYEVEVWSDGEGSHTHWTHCPPQAFVRTLVEAGEDRGELDAFYRS